MIRIDFEFFGSNELHPTLVCAAMDGVDYWLLDGSDTEKLKQDISKIKSKLGGYYTAAEARCFIALGFDPLDFPWIDLYAEFKMQQNCNDKYQYGHYIDDKGNVKFSEPPDYDDVDEDDEASNAKVPSNLVNAVFKNTGIIISSKEKHAVRDIILSKDIELIQANKQRIMAYCQEDTKHLIPLYESITKFYHDAGLRNFEKDMLDRGAYSAATAKCEQVGMPINLPLLKKIIEKTPFILEESQDIVNEKIPMFVKAYTPPPKIKKPGDLLYVNKKGGDVYAKKEIYHEYKEIPAHKDTGAFQDFIKELEIKEWPRTKTGAYKTDKKTLETYRFIPAIDLVYAHNKTESSLKWFNNNNGDGFFEAFGSDNRVRPFFGVLGTQTGRNAAKAKTFVLAMASWLRVIIQPPPGWYIIAGDWRQQEVAVAAALSRDKNLKDAYLSGDTYTAFAKLAGAIPENGSKKTHPEIRDKFKSTKLGIQYGMGKDNLRKKLSFDCGRPFTLDEAIELITHHKTVFPDYWKYLYEVSHSYQRGYPIITRDGWVLWQDNPRMTSVRNSPVQGNSASITRRATIDAWKAGLIVMCQLHDALYVLSQDPERDMPIIKKVMTEAVRKILQDDFIDIGIDFKIISHDEYWVEDKGRKEWETIRKHLQV